MKCLSRFPRDCFLLISGRPVRIGVGLFLYGVYTVLYILCIYVLATRKRNRYRVYVVLITALYIAATIEVGMKLAVYALQAQMDVHDYTIDLPLPTKLFIEFQNAGEGALSMFDSAAELRFGLQIITSVANFLTDTLLLWRFYHTWGRTNLRVMISPCIVAIVANIYGCIQTASKTIAALDPTQNKSPLVYFSICALVSNVMLTSLIAGRIFYIGYQVGKYLPFRATVPTLYKTVFSATLESGLIYPVALIIYTACVVTNLQEDSIDFSRKTPNPNPMGYWIRALVAGTMWDSLITIMGIASTLIIVRVSLGIAIHDEKSFKETIVREYEATQMQESLHSVMDIRRQCSGYMESTLGTLDADLEVQRSKQATVIA
ncbi:hypothetical protein PM082_018527 [Marasmius tenuissimus]|nr:hypothetical protein PM082_018527 [Marasmius tenuissimus]